MVVKALEMDIQQHKPRHCLRDCMSTHVHANVDKNANIGYKFIAEQPIRIALIVSPGFYI